jgi:drug/metabolite transporter (DMT)-like permease
MKPGRSSPTPRDSAGATPSSAARQQRHVFALSATLSLLWGLAFVVQKVGLRDSNALAFAAGRAGVAAATLAPALGAVRSFSARDHLLAAALGLTNVTAFFAFQVEGIRRIGAGPSAALVFTQPLMVLVLAAVLLREPISPRRLGGAGLGLAGVGVVAVKEWTLGSSIGVILLLLAALSWAIGTVLLRAAAGRPLLPLLALQMLYGALPLIALALYDAPPPTPTTRLVLTLLSAGVVASAGGWLVLAVLLRRADAASISSALYFVPVVGVACGAVFLSEPLRPSLLVGMLLISIGIRLVVVQPRPPDPSGEHG